MSTEPPRDQWAEWLLRRRFGGDRSSLDQHMRFLRPIRDRILRYAAIVSGETVLDLGTGDGLIGFEALDQVGGSGAVIFSDISDDLIDECRQLASEMEVSDRCEFVEMPAEDLSPIADESVDVVTARSVLIYIDDKQRAFEEVYRVLKPGGRMSIYEPINRASLPRSSNEFTGGFNVVPVRDIASKVQAVFEQAQPHESDSMMNFDERDFLGWLELVGFSQIDMTYELRVGPVPGMDWETYLNTAFNPRMPTLQEAMDESLTQPEQRTFSDYLKPLVEQGDRQFRLGEAYLRAVKQCPSGG